MRIRTAEQDDINFLMTLDNRCFDNPYSYATWMQLIMRRSIQVACDPDVVGYLAYFSDDPHLIARLGVTPSRRRCGIGSLLLSTLQTRGVKCTLTEDVMLEGVGAFFKANGFVAKKINDSFVFSWNFNVSNDSFGMD